MKIIKISNKKQLIQFVKFPFKLYKNSKQWVPPIISEEINNFTKGVNPNLEDCDVNLFLAMQNNIIVGRVAAIINWHEINTQKIDKIRCDLIILSQGIDINKCKLKKFLHISPQNM